MSIVRKRRPAPRLLRATYMMIDLAGQNLHIDQPDAVWALLQFWAEAEVVPFEHLVEAGSMADAKATGWVRIEGKDYVMVDDDVVEFRFNV